MLKVKVDSRKVEDVFAALRRQLPFATATAINECLKKAQTAQRAHQQSAFSVHNKRFMDQAVKIKPFAKKTSLSGTILIDPPGGQARADILVQHEKGGTKLPRSGRGVLAVPVELKRGSGGVPKAMRPKALSFKNVPGAPVAVGEKGTLLIRSKGRRGVIVQRVGGTSRKARLKVLYALGPSARLRPRLGFFSTVWGSLQKTWHAEFDKAVNLAIATAKR